MGYYLWFCKVEEVCLSVFYVINIKNKRRIEVLLYFYDYMNSIMYWGAYAAQN